MRDFTLAMYEIFLGEFLHAGYGFVTFAEHVQRPGNKERKVILRHDVDKKPLRSIQIAEMENRFGIKGTFYFRVVKNRLPEEVIRHIAKLGHEIGYHYEDLKTAGGAVEKALVSFKRNLTILRESAPVETACMHGSPFSKHDNRELWKSHHYGEFGIVGEPYFDIDFSNVLYLTDTGRSWSGDRFNVRDRIAAVDNLSRRYQFKSTQDIIHAVKAGDFPEQAMITVHPQRWADEWFPWIGEWVGQNIKNLAKYFVAKKRNWQ